jgi:hypothetical protein
MVSWSARLTAFKGAEVLFYPTAIDGIQEKRQYGVNQYGAGWMYSDAAKWFYVAASKIP